MKKSSKLPLVKAVASVTIFGEQVPVEAWHITPDGTRATLRTATEAITLWDRLGRPLPGLPDRVDALPVEMEAATPRDGAARPVVVWWRVSGGGPGILTKAAARAGLAAFSGVGYLTRCPLEQKETPEQVDRLKRRKARLNAKKKTKIKHAGDRRKIRAEYAVLLTRPGMTATAAQEQLAAQAQQGRAGQARLSMRYHLAPCATRYDIRRIVTTTD